MSTIQGDIHAIVGARGQGLTAVRMWTSAKTPSVCTTARAQTHLETMGARVKQAGAAKTALLTSMSAKVTRVSMDLHVSTRTVTTVVRVQSGGQVKTAHKISMNVRWPAFVSTIVLAQTTLETIIARVHQDGTGKTVPMTLTSVKLVPVTIVARALTLQVTIAAHV